MKILNIEETTFKHKYTTFEGFIISLDDDVKIKVGIDNDWQCCEQWGYVTSQDDLEYFIGAEYLDGRVTNKALETIDLSHLDLYEGSCLFFTVFTSKGDFQLVCYNEHNGYYSHESVVVVNETVIHEQYL